VLSGADVTGPRVLRKDQRVAMTSEAVSVSIEGTDVPAGTALYGVYAVVGTAGTGVDVAP
jgi:hypothetical protein